MEKELKEIDRLLKAAATSKLGNLNHLATIPSWYYSFLVEDGMIIASKSTFAAGHYFITPKGRVKFLSGGYLGEYEKSNSQKKLLDTATFAAIFIAVFELVDVYMTHFHENLMWYLFGC